MPRIVVDLYVITTLIIIFFFTARRYATTTWLVASWLAGCLSDAGIVSKWQNLS